MHFATKNFRLLFCHGLGNAKSDLIACKVQQWALERNIELQSMVYENYGDKRRIWNINDWTKDIKSELDRFSASRTPETGTVIVGNSAASQAVLRAVTDKTCPSVAGLVMISPGVGIKLEHYMERILPGSVERLNRGEILEHPSADPNVCIRVDIKCLEDFVNNCVLRRQNSLEMLKFPVRIVHGLHDKLVPYRNSLELLDKIQSKDKSILLINDGHFVKDQNAIGYALDSLWNSLHEKSVNEKTVDLRKRQFA